MPIDLRTLFDAGLRDLTPESVLGLRYRTILTPFTLRPRGSPRTCLYRFRKAVVTVPELEMVTVRMVVVLCSVVRSPQRFQN